MARVRRNFSPFSLSFLDIMSCGFGAVVLLFLIIKHNVEANDHKPLQQSEATSEVKLLDEDILQGKEGLAKLRNSVAQVEQKLVIAQGLANRVTEDINDKSSEIETITSKDTAGQIEKLKDTLKQMDQDKKKLEAENSKTGENIRKFVGEGNREYLTGLKLGGNRILVLLDRSASMLDKTIVNIIRRRNMSPEQQRESPKWKQVVNTVDWLTTQIEPGTQIQIIGFTDTAKSLLPGSDGKWVTVTDGHEIDGAVNALRASYPKGPTSLHAAFSAIRGLEPKPDNVYLLVDGLPTMGEVLPTRQGVTSRERLDHFNRAVRQLPLGVPVNVILFAMEGDPQAAPAFWVLALRTGGSMLAPAEDWP